MFAGLYHLGHVLGLLEAGVLPHIISGTSGGSVIGAILCTRTDDEIRRDLNPEILIQKLTCFDRPWSERLKSLVREGCLFSFDDWLEKIQWYVPLPKFFRDGLVVFLMVVVGCIEGLLAVT